MKFFRIFQPKATISEAEINKGLHWAVWEGTAAMGFFSITTSGILVAYALILGANNFHIGVLAATPFIMQLVQIPAIWLVEKVRRRKVIAVSAWFAAQLCWFPIALIPFMLPVPRLSAVYLLLGIMAVRGIFTAITSASWNSWQRDLIPQSILGRFFSRRLAFATVSAVIFSLGASLFVDFFHSQNPDKAVFGYSYLLLFGATFLGMMAPVFMSLVPEPLMQAATDYRESIGRRMLKPFHDVNFRRLLQFLFYWGFASNLAIPFFAVHMLQTIGLPVSAVIGFSILSQIFNILFLRVWGQLTDRYGNRSVLSIGVSLYLVVILGWIFTTMPGRYFLTIPLLVVLHIFAGIASAAVTITVGTIGLKLAPREDATSYLAAASLSANIGGGLGPIVGGVLANFFSLRQMVLTFTWTDPSSTTQFSALSVGGRDFLFGIAFFVGLFTIGVLALIKEEGEHSREVILESLLTPMRELSRPMSSVPGFTFLSNFPLGFLKRVPGLDVAFGVTIYQIAEMARIATAAAVRGRRVTKRLADELNKILLETKKPKRTVSKHGIELARHMARGAMHALDEKPLELGQLVTRVLEDVVTVTSRSGVKPSDAVLGASEGIVQGAHETGTDISIAAAATVLAALGIATRIGLSDETAVSIAKEGTLRAAEALGPETAAEVMDGIEK